MRNRRKSPRNQPQNPGLLFFSLEAGARQEQKELPFPVLVVECPRVDEENQIKAWLDSMLVQAENFPNLSFRSVSFNGIPEFLG